MSGWRKAMLGARERRPGRGERERASIRQAEVFHRQHLADLAMAEAAVIAYATYYNYHRLHGQLGWQTPAERFDSTLVTDLGFQQIPALAGVADLLSELLATAA